MELVQSKYKKTEVGLIPLEWDVVSLSEAADFLDGQRRPIKSSERISGEFPYYGASGIIDYVNAYIFDDELILLGEDGENILSRNLPLVFIVKGKVWVNNHAHVMKPKSEFDITFLTEYLESLDYSLLNSGTAQPKLNKQSCLNIKVVKPPLTEQKAIATALSNVDDLIANLDKLITKKKAIKQGAMQQLLTPPHKGGKRLAGFNGEWEFLSIESVADCLDNLRVPLNGEQRGKMNGDIPYCGANGVVDYVDDYVVDDDIILMAEDGGYFDEYKTRHIAYRMIGKCWVNNHAHILKAKKHISQAYLFYTLVHKNILDYINGGTRAKLNKSEMNKIESWFPNSQNEQNAIAQILSDMDAELTQLETKKSKYQDIKQGMMQELLTGKTRLI